MSIERSHDFVCVGFFLSSYGEKRDSSVDPPQEIGASGWRNAYAAFYDALADGRELRTFTNSLKATRDAFDAWVDSGRRGWRDGDHPKPLTPIEESVFSEWKDRPRSELWSHISRFANADAATAPASVLNDVDLSSGLDHPDGERRAEGGRKVRVLATVERSPGLRAAALRLHGAICQACCFDFGAVYGAWGKDFAEVHHVVPLAADGAPVRETDPRSDLVVLCANCHRMVHRRREMVLSLDEIRSKVSAAGLRAWLARLATDGRGA